MNVPLTGWTEHEAETYFPQLGVAIILLEPGEPIGMYHREADQEDFLILEGEALLIVEGEERPLGRWDFVHCPPHTEHMIVGAGEGRCTVLAMGAREHQAGEDWGAYTVNAVALRHGVGVREETNDPAVAYSRFGKSKAMPYRDGLLPGLGNPPATTDVQRRAPVAQHRRIRATADPLPHLRVEERSLRRLHRQMPRERLEKCDVLVRRVAGLPQVAAHFNVLEEAGRLELRSLIGDQLRRRRRPLAVPALADRVVHVLDLGEERVEAGREGVAAFQNARCPPGRSSSYAFP